MCLPILCPNVRMCGYMWVYVGVCECVCGCVGMSVCGCVRYSIALPFLFLSLYTNPSLQSVSGQDAITTTTTTSITTTTTITI